MERPADQALFTFAGFRFDAASGELHGRGTVVKLRAQVARVLSLLVERPGVVVDRETLRRVLWPDKRIVLFEVSIAAIVRELRRALGDDAKSPRYVETLPTRGYRFIAPVEQVSSWPETGPVRPAMQAPRRPSGAWLRSGRMLLILSLWLVFDGSVTIESVRPMQAASDATLTIRIEPLVPYANDHAALLARQIIDDELPGYLGAALPPDVRIIAGKNSQISARSDEATTRGAQVFLVAGGIRVEGDALVVSAQGRSAVDGQQVWSDQYRVPAEDPSFAGREAAARMAGAILSDLVPVLMNAARPLPPEPALESYRRALEYRRRQSEESADSAARHFQHAIDAAAGYAAAHAGLADALMAWPGPSKTPDLVERARAAATRALELAPDNPLALRVLGDIHLFQDRAWTRAADRLTRAAQLAPADARARHSLAAWMSARGLHREALLEIELARALDPSSIAISFDVMAFHFYARDFPETIESARRLDMLWPGNLASERFSMLSYQAMDDLAGAERIARRALAKWGVTDGNVLEKYWTMTARALELAPPETQIDPAQTAWIYAHAGKLREALEQIEAAAESQHFSYLMPYLGVTPALDPLRGHPRFEQVLRSLGQAGHSEFYLSGARPRATGD